MKVDENRLRLPRTSAARLRVRRDAVKSESMLLFQLSSVSNYLSQFTSFLDSPSPSVSSEGTFLSSLDNLS